MKALNLIYGLLFPPKCVLCGDLLRSGEQDLCKECRSEAHLFPNGKRKLQFLDSFAAVWYYEGSIRRSMLRFKFYGRRSHAVSYGRLLAMELTKEFPDGFDVLTWIPVSRSRRLRRGYDQVGKDLQYSYDDGDLYHFMDTETWEETLISRDMVGDNFKFVKEEMMCKISSFKGKVFSVEPPTFVELAVVATEPGVRGDTATNVTKPATLETGAVVKVPIFINEGEVLKIDTRTGEYVERV